MAGLRWIIALPTAIVASVVAMFPIHWFLMLIYYLKSLPSDDAFITKDVRPIPFFGIPFETMERSAIAALLPGVFIFVGAYVAPAHKWRTALVFAILWLAFIAAALTFALTTTQFVVEFTFTSFLVIALGVGGVFYWLVRAGSSFGPKSGPR